MEVVPNDNPENKPEEITEEVSQNTPAPMARVKVDLFVKKDIPEALFEKKTMGMADNMLSGMMAANVTKEQSRAMIRGVLKWGAAKLPLKEKIRFGAVLSFIAYLILFGIIGNIIWIIHLFIH